ncbi:unnamed protein product [Microthlaspi erraticum]|uniref:Bet v I/Major latex protein domain-containing protein n=1 Tax=Microthlaspi erraticum TaxID=1685480 RepID=A0A6D2KEZ5_9BRAS|nr:unnamed protein product [Microthlaspi erraticum]
MLEEEVAVDVEIKTAAKKFHMFVGSQHLSKATRYIRGCDLVEGEWGKVGSIVLWNLVFDGEPRVSKDMIEAMDLEKNLIQWRVLEGPVKKYYKSVLKTMEVSPKKEGSGNVVKLSIKYERIDEKMPHPESLLQFLVEVTKEVDRYLLSEE